MKQLLYIAAMIFIVLSGKGQDLSYRQFSTMEGMPSAQVYYMFQDQLGYMWFATDRGIAKYDGKSFVQYDQRNGLPSSTVFKYFPQKNGNVWCSTFENKLFYFKPELADFKSYQYNDSLVKYSIGGLIEDLIIEENGSIHLGYQNVEGVLSIDSAGKVLNGVWDREGAGAGGIMSIIENNGNQQLTYYLETDSTDVLDFNFLKNSEVRTCWFSAEHGSYCKTGFLNKHGIFSMEHLLIIQGPDLKYKRIIVDKPIIGLGVFSKDYFWIGLRKGGMQVYDLNGNLVHKFLNNKSVTNVFHDQHSGLWISTLYNGVFYAKDKRIRKYDIDKSVFYITNGKDSQVLVGTNEGQIYECTNEQPNFLADNGLGVPFLAGFNKSTDDYALFSSGKLLFSGQIIDIPGWVGCSSENENKPILFGSYGAIYWIDTANNKLKKSDTGPVRVRSIDWGENGIWIGTLSGLYYCDTLNGSIDQYSHFALERRIEAIKSTDSSVFFGTMGDGLVVKTADTIIQVSMLDGLSSNLVHNLFVENDSTIWVATNNGLNRVCIYSDSINVNVYNKKDGLKDNYISDVHVKNEQVWIGTRSGLFYMQKPPLQAISSPIDLRLRIETIHHYGRLLEGKELSELSHDQNDLLINYNTIFYGGNEAVEYRYKMEGIDKDWTMSFSRSVSYKALAHGAYRLVIQARTKGTDWSQNEETLDFTIFPPFYKTAWFLLSVLVVVVLVIYFFFKIRVLTYNRDIVRELLRMLLKRLSPRSKQFKIKVQGSIVKINSLDVGFVKASGNYLEIYTVKNRFVTRMKISDFENSIPDKLDYVRVNRSYIVRIDKISTKSTKALMVMNQEIPIGRTYQKEIAELLF
ncbi:MAG: hypothetical protein HOH13_11025 [Crocinitomicaceae bacterium]|nr:hypothetical protein [Crocinitomicaceae bacterium]